MTMGNIERRARQQKFDDLFDGWQFRKLFLKQQLINLKLLIYI